MTGETRNASQLVVSKADFDRDRRRYIAQASPSKLVVVVHEKSNRVSAVFGGSLRASAEADGD